MPDLTLQRRREWLIEDIEEIGCILWENQPQNFGKDWTPVKAGNVNTILCELARRMRDGETA